MMARHELANFLEGGRPRPPLRTRIGGRGRPPSNKSSTSMRTLNIASGRRRAPLRVVA